jgi:membrane protease subunit (stomatin/prohibitin family)
MGSPRQTVRIEPALLAEIETVVERSIDKRFAGPWTISSLIVQALKEKLDHLKRSSRSKRKRQQRDAQQRTWKCEECAALMTLDSAGRIETSPDGSQIACCWSCLSVQGLIEQKSCPM